MPASPSPEGPFFFSLDEPQAFEALSRFDSLGRLSQTQLFILLLARAFDGEPGVRAFFYQTRLCGDLLFHAHIDGGEPLAWPARPRSDAPPLPPPPSPAPPRERGALFRAWLDSMSILDIARFDGARFLRPGGSEPLIPALMRQGLPREAFPAWLAAWEARELSATPAPRSPPALGPRSL